MAGGIIRERGPPGWAGVGTVSRVTVPLWQLSESTRMRTPAANRLSSRYSSSSINWLSHRHQVSSLRSGSSPVTSATCPPWPEKVRKKKSPFFSVLAALRSAASTAERVAWAVISTVGFMPLALAMACMSSASASQAARSPLQPP